MQSKKKMWCSREMHISWELSEGSTHYLNHIPEKKLVEKNCILGFLMISIAWPRSTLWSSLSRTSVFLFLSVLGLHCHEWAFSNFHKQMKVKVTQSCLTLFDPMDYSVHGILQARILEWVAFPFSRGSSQPRGQTQVSRIAGRLFTSWATGEAHNRGRAQFAVSGLSFRGFSLQTMGSRVCGLSSL